MNGDCEDLISAYLTWLRGRIQFRDIEGVCEITTPFLDRHNDRIQIYVHRINGHLKISDDGNTVADLEMSGCSIDTPNRKAMLQVILNGHGVRQENGELFVDAMPETFPQKKHSLVQAILNVNDMFMTAKHRVDRFFREDVAAFLDDNGVRYSPDVAFQGKTGFSHHFDFVIPKSKNEPERILKTVNHLNKDSATSLLFSWTDTKDIRPPKSIVYAIFNDVERAPSPDAVSALEQYDVRTIPWTKRALFAPQLAA